MRWLLPLLFWLPAMAWAGDAERVGIEAERQRLIEQSSKEERECQQRFAVTDCVEDVRRRSREALAALRARELDLDDAERQRRAAQRRAAIEAKQKAQAARPPAALPPAALPPAAQPPAALPTEAPPRQAAPPAAAATAASAPLPPRSRADDSQARAAQAAERARASQRRREEAQAALERVQKRVAEREASGKTATPLPLPDAASAPGR